jgi:hypothetical protein
MGGGESEEVPIPSNPNAKPTSPPPVTPAPNRDRLAADAARRASVPSEHHKQTDKEDGDYQDPGGSRVHASLLSNSIAGWYSS